MSVPLVTSTQFISCTLYNIIITLSKVALYSDFIRVYVSCVLLETTVRILVHNVYNGALGQSLFMFSLTVFTLLIAILRCGSKEVQVKVKNDFYKNVYTHQVQHRTVECERDTWLPYSCIRELDKLQPCLQNEVCTYQTVQEYELVMTFNDERAKAGSFNYMQLKHCNVWESVHCFALQHHLEPLEIRDVFFKDLCANRIGYCPEEIAAASI